MTTKKTTVLMAAVLAFATVLAAGLTVLPSSVQEAQANPCSVDVSGGDAEGGSQGGGAGGVAGNGGAVTDPDPECKFIGPVEFDED